MMAVAGAMIAGFLVGAGCVGLFLVMFLFMVRGREQQQAYINGRSVGQYEQELHRQNQKLKEAEQERKKLEQALKLANEASKPTEEQGAKPEINKSEEN